MERCLSGRPPSAPWTTRPRRPFAPSPGGTDERNNLRLVHSECHRQHHAGDGKRTTEPC
ncbi:HNH endonuclease [Streptomyces avermitilis]|uniref:HNH endonuclease n=1 Tax=Streptomyces avermitilis TaxID=33903 RepID=UPI0033DC61D8